MDDLGHVHQEPVGCQQARDAAGDFTAFFYVHLVLAVVSIVLGTIIGVLGWRGWRARTAK